MFTDSSTVCLVNKLRIFPYKEMDLTGDWHHVSLEYTRIFLSIRIGFSKTFVELVINISRVYSSVFSNISRHFRNNKE